jgi:hypothetical protein
LQETILVVTWTVLIFMPLQKVSLPSSYVRTASDPGYLVGPAAIADAIKDMRAISTVIVHKFSLPIQDIKTKAELDLSRKGLNHLDVIVIAALLPLNVSRAIFGYLYYR